MALKTTIKGKDGQRGAARSVMSTARLLASLAAMIVMLLTSTLHAADRQTRVVEFLSSGTYTAATGYSSAFEVSAWSEATFFIDVTARADTSTLDITVQTSADGITWFTNSTLSSSAQIAATGQNWRYAGYLGKYMRIKYVVAVTSMTFSVKAVFKN